MKLTEIQENWLQALESGDYKQCSEKLKDNETNSYCCLGVATTLIEPASERLKADYDGDEVLSNFVKDELGLKSNTGIFSFDYSSVKPRSLTALNDIGESFAKIAAFIRANPEDVFENVE